MIPKQYRHIELAYLDMMAAGDPQTRDLLLATLREELPDAVADLREAFLKKEWKMMKEVAHNLKSTLAFIGNREMIMANTRLWEQLDHSDHGEHLETFIQVIEQIMPLVMKELNLALKRAN